MAAHVRQAAQQAGRPVKVLMDLGGPKLRTGLLPPGPAVLKVRPQRDIFGRVTQPALVGLRPTGSSGAVANATAHVGVKADWLAGLEVGDSIEFVDARDAHRTLKVVATRPQGALAELDQTAYFVPSTRLTRHRHGKHAPANSRLNDLPRQETRLTLQTGDKLRLVSEAAFAKGDDGTRSDRLSMPEMPCTLPEVFEQVRPGEPIWFDDGRIGGVIRAANAKGMTVEVTHAREGGERLASDKGINLPDSQLDLPALTEADLRNLPAVAQLADMVGLSFVQHAADVDLLRQHLLTLNAGHIGIVLKIETRRAFENLPALLLSAMQSPAVGIMIARGDLAVECGFERLAEIQEELLWAAEAAHMPVIWATQVLETLAKTGMPSRAEITDAAMGERAECVMLNKGPHILAAMHTLDNIMQRMQMHQSKKRSLLRALHAWTTPAVATPTLTPPAKAPQTGRPHVNLTPPVRVCAGAQPVGKREQYDLKSRNYRQVKPITFAACPQLRRSLHLNRSHRGRSNRWTFCSTPMSGSRLPCSPHWKLCWALTTSSSSPFWWADCLPNSATWRAVWAWALPCCRVWRCCSR
jgi:pyruvate kinase